MSDVERRDNSQLLQLIDTKLSRLEEVFNLKLSGINDKLDAFKKALDESRAETKEDIKNAYKCIEEGDNATNKRIETLEQRVDDLEKTGGNTAKTFIKWVGGVIGIIVIGGLLTLAGFGIVHFLENVPGIGNHPNTQDTSIPGATP
jgi:hypothetical protein